MSNLSTSSHAVVPSEPAIRLSPGEINALTQRGLWSRLGFSTLVAALACTVISWRILAVWLAAILIWEFVIRCLLERWATLALGNDASEWSLLKLAAVYTMGTAIYAAMGALGFLSHTTLGAQIAMGWIAGAAIHAFVYFSNRFSLLVANLSGPVLVALAMPSIAAGGLTWQAGLSTVVTVTLLASAAVFAIDRNALLGRLSKQIDARRAAEEANAAKSQFLKIISHELRTPLNAVIGYSEMLEEDLADMGADQQRRDASHIREAGEHLLALINDILRLSQQEANAPLLQHAETDISALLAEIDVTARALAGERGNRFVLEAAAFEPATLDRAKLADCLSRLVSNACKFTTDGLITLRVWTEADCILFEVADTGVGIAPDVRAHLFEPFVQSDDFMTRRFGGAGLGLAVARKNARLMGGEISVESVLGHGSIFTLSLPLNVGADEDQELARCEPHRASA